MRYVIELLWSVAQCCIQHLLNNCFFLVGAQQYGILMGLFGLLADLCIHHQCMY